MGEPTAAPIGFTARVAEAVAATGPLCAGIDPSASLLEEWGLADSAVGLREFGLRCIEAFAGVVPVVKPQVAFFERWGAAGMAALESVLSAARGAGLLVIADAKRGDIASTMSAYASAWLDPAGPLAADAVTVLPYMGIGSLQPMFDSAATSGRGVIVVVRGSNPDGRVLQEATVRTGDLPGGGEARSVEDMLLGSIGELNRDLSPPGTVGAVVGATLEPSGFDLAGLGGVILAPGVGAQGGTSDGVARLFGGCAPGTVLPNVSRSLLSAGPDRAALARAARTERDAMRRALARR